MRPSLIVISTVDGRHRGGAKFNEGANRFSLDRFSEEQLREITRDPVLTVVAGDLVLPGDVRQFLDMVERWKAADARGNQGDEQPAPAGEQSLREGIDRSKTETAPVKKRAAK